MTLFLAAVLHGIVILGITFSAGTREKESAPGLEVLLVSDELPTAARNDSATYLAQRTQLGSGNTDHPVPPRNRSSGQPRAQDGLDGGAAPEAADLADVRGSDDDRVVATSAPRPDIRYFSDVELGTLGAQAAAPAADSRAAEPGPDDDPGPVQLRGPHRDDLWVTPDSREATLAPYLDGWRRRVERIGTLNYPVAARRAGAQGNPVLEVAIGTDGRLQSVRIRRSSGDAALDHAALQILKLASPFNPFPAELAAKYRTLRFAYEWQFVGGRVTAGAVSTLP
ncbi:MAG TPA: energy transducer TonB [Steroidobacteraceae bacterium]|nr:energy transducer TonB [Steroidobacteraceae bacterium]